MEGGSAGARRNIASLDRKLERVLSYRASEEVKEEDCCTVVSPAAEAGGNTAVECDRDRKLTARNGDGQAHGHAQAPAQAQAQAQADLNSSSTLSSQMCSDADSFPTSSEAVCSSGVSTVTADVMDKSRGKQVLEEASAPREHAATREEEKAVCRERKVKQAESADTAWTDDRHSSYLNSIEALFVRNMYDNDFGGLDAYRSPHAAELSEHDCVESRAAECTSSPPELFELWQNGCLYAYYRPQVLEWPVPTAPAVLHSPWVQHFKLKRSTASAAHVSEADQDESVPAVVEENSPVDEVDTSPGGAVEVPGAEDGFFKWHTRLQRQGSKSKDSLQRKESASQGKRWSSSPDKSKVDSTRSKRQKCQEELALIDLEMEEQFSLRRLKADAGDHAAGSDEQRVNDEPELVDQHHPVVVSCGTANSVMRAEPGMLQRRSFRRLLSSNSVCVKSDVIMPVLDVDQVVPLLGGNGVEDLDERVRVPDITNRQPELAALDRRKFRKGVGSVGRESKTVSEQGNSEAPKVVRDSPNETFAAACKVGTEAEEEAGSAADIRYEVDINPRKRNSSKTWTWGLQGLRRPLQEKQQGDAAE